MAEKLSMVSTTERLLADIADTLRKLADRPRLMFAAADVTIPDEETRVPAAPTDVKKPSVPAAPPPPETKAKAAPAKPAAGRARQ